MIEHDTIHLYKSWVLKWRTSEDFAHGSPIRSNKISSLPAMHKHLEFLEACFPV